MTSDLMPFMVSMTEADDDVREDVLYGCHKGNCWSKCAPNDQGDRNWCYSSNQEDGHGLVPCSQQLDCSETWRCRGPCSPSWASERDPDSLPIPIAIATTGALAATGIAVVAYNHHKHRFATTTVSPETTSSDTTVESTDASDTTTEGSIRESTEAEENVTAISSQA